MIESLPEYDDLPSPLWQALHAFNQDPSPFRQVHRFIDALEVLVKLHTVYAVSIVVHRLGLDDSARGLLAEGLRTPSLGIWWQFAREFAKGVQKGEHPEELGTLGTNILGPLSEALDGEDNLISFRNHCAHGATPSDEQCVQDLQLQVPRLKALLEACRPVLATAKLLIQDQEAQFFCCCGDQQEPHGHHFADVPKNHTALLWNGEAIDLHPLLVYGSEKSSGHEQRLFYFYDKLRPQELRLLNYHKALHLRNADLRKDFLALYPIHEWMRLPETQEFRERIESLTENFKGRVNEMRTVADFVRHDQSGILFFWGAPGTGKSTLLAECIKRLRWSPELLKNDPAFGGKTLPKREVVEYLIRRDMPTGNAEHMFYHLNRVLEARFRLDLTPETDARRGAEQLMRRLEGVSKSKSRLVLVIDGLDESPSGLELLALLPRHAPEQVRLIYASRDQPRVRLAVWENLDREQRVQTTVGGLCVEDTRALMADYVSKYSISSGYVQSVVQKSQGNPLYLKLLCSQLEQGSLKLNDSRNLPENISSMYTDTLNRLTDPERGGHSRSGDLLRLMAAARNHLSAVMVRDILGLNSLDEALGLIATCGELLYENSATEKWDGWQLFHESLREWLRTDGTHSAGVIESMQKLAQWCAKTWHDEQQNVHSRTYASAYLPGHLLEAGGEENVKEAHRVALNRLWRDTVMELGSDPSLMRQALEEVQKALVSQGKVSKGKVSQEKVSLREILDLSALRRDEPERFWEMQMGRMKLAARQGDWEGVVRMARMGRSAYQRMMLIFAAGWGCAMEELGEWEKMVETWLNEAGDERLGDMWKVLKGEGR